MKTALRFILISGVLTLLTSGSGCTGARGKIVLEELNHPVSMSPYIYGKNGQILSIDKGLSYSGGLFIKKNYYGMFYSIIRITGDGDLNKQIDDSISAFNADGIVNFHYVVEQGSTNGCGPLTWLPIWPGSSQVVFMGDIVKVSKGGAK